MENNSARPIGEVAIIQERELGLEKRALSSKSIKPRVPDGFINLPTKLRLKALKKYIGSFQYKLTSQTNFNSHKLRPLACIMDTARMIIHTPQPIKCVEAVFVALYLTADLHDVERVPVGFKSELNGQVYQHIVLLVQHNGKWGALGISRCPDLMNKHLIFDRMSSVIGNFKASYESQGHIVLKIRVGLPVEHNTNSHNFVCWRHLNLNLNYTSWSECIDAINKHSNQGKILWNLWIISKKSEDPLKSSANGKAPLDTKVFSFHHKVKKKNNLASQNATIMKAKSITLESPVIFTRKVSSTLYKVAKTSNFQRNSPDTIFCVACPSLVGNSKFRVSKNSNHNERNDNEAYLEDIRRTKVMKIEPTRMILSKVLEPVTRGFLGKYFETKIGKRGTISLSSSQLHPKMILVDSNPLVKRIPLHISYQTLNARALIQRSPNLQKIRWIDTYSERE